MNICIVVGARPNFMKVAPIIRALQKAQQQGRDVAFQLVYAGRKDDLTLDDSLFENLEISRPEVYMDVDCENLNELTGQVMSKFEHYLQHRSTDVVIVVDDLASTMAAAIVTKKQGVTLAHIAAGTRSFDISMPKEINRLVIDGLSDILFTAGMSNNSIANREGAELSKVYMVGNILIDNIRFLRDRMKMPNLVQQYGLQEKGYMVFTMNRKVLIADTDNLQKMIKSIVDNAAGTPVIASLRKKAKEVVEEILRSNNISSSLFRIIEPQSYLSFSWLTAHARGIITDSGNVAEEATFNGVPCITLNSYTEHIETVKQGTNVLVGENAEMLAKMVADMVSCKWKQSSIPDRWDGRSAERILQILLDYHKKD